MASSDNMVRRRSQTIDMSEAPIARRTRSMHKRMSCNLQSTPIEKSPKRRVRKQQKTKDPNEVISSNTESPTKDVENSEEFGISESSNQAGPSVNVSRSSKRQKSKDSTIKGTEALKISRKSVQCENVQSDIQKDIDTKSPNSGHVSANTALALSPKTKNVPELRDDDAKKNNKSPTHSSEQSDSEKEVNKSGKRKNTRRKSQKFNVVKELPSNSELSDGENGRKPKKVSRLSLNPTENTMDVEEETNVKPGSGKSIVTSESPKKEESANTDIRMSESLKKGRKKSASSSFVQKAPAQDTIFNLENYSNSEDDQKGTKEKPPKELPSSSKNKKSSNIHQSDSSVDVPIKVNNKETKSEFNNSKVVNSELDSNASNPSPSQFKTTSEKKKHKRNIVSHIENNIVSSGPSPMNNLVKKNKDYSKSVEDKSVSSEDGSVRSNSIQSSPKSKTTDNVQKLGDSYDIHVSDSEIKPSKEEKKKMFKDRSSGAPEKVNQCVTSETKVVSKTTKDSYKELNSKFQAQKDKKYSPSISSLKKNIPIENCSSLVKKTSPKNQASNQFSVAYPDSDSDAESRKAIMESAQKRIEQNLSTSESDSRYLIKTTHKCTFRKPVEEGSSDSGSAPENISFETGRKTAMESLKNAVENIQREKQRRKEKRKERLEKLKQQKEEKLIRLKEKLASQEDASCSSSEESGYEEVAYESKRGKKKRVPKTRTLRTEKENVDGSSVMVLKKTAFSDMDSDNSAKKVAIQQVPASGGLKRLPSDVLDNLPDQIPLKYPKMSQDDGNKKKWKKDKAEHKDGPEKDFKIPSNLDYIPLETDGPTKFGIVPLERAIKAQNSVGQQAADFRKNMLYGSHIKREPTKSSTIYQQKMKASGNDIQVR